MTRPKSQPVAEKAEDVARNDGLPSIVEMRPADDSTDGVGLAYDRLVSVRTENAAEIERLEALRPGMLLTSTPEAIEENDTLIRRRRVLVEQLALLEIELRRMFEVAKAREEDDAFLAKFAEVEQASKEFTAEFTAAYPSHAQAIADLMKREAVVQKQRADLREMPGSNRRRHEPWETPTYPVLSPVPRAQVQAVGAAPSQTASFGDAVKLPAVEIDGALVWTRA